jgi:hypothetical protein
MVKANGKQKWYWRGEKVTEQEHERLRKRSSGV